MLLLRSCVLCLGVSAELILTVTLSAAVCAELQLDDTCFNRDAHGEQGQSLKTCSKTQRVRFFRMRLMS